jgi:CysZ protein
MPGVRRYIHGVTNEVATAAPNAADRSRGPTGIGRDFFAGISFLFRGIGMYARTPKLMFLGLIPAVIAGALVTAAIVAAVYFSGNLADLMTPFDHGWSDGLRETIRVIAMVAIIGVTVLVGFFFFAALTLLIGEPFYEKISYNVEAKLGGDIGEPDLPFWRTLGRSMKDSLRLLVFTVLTGVLLFAGGFIPVVGETVVPVIGALVSSWVLALELSSVPFERRGIRFRQRRRLLRKRRSMAVGFGLATFICFLIPLGAILVMPAAVAGATLLARRTLGLPDAPALRS